MINALAVDNTGNVYVADNNRIQKFTNNGIFLSKWGSAGSDDGKFSGIIGLATDSTGNIYAADSGNYRIQKFDTNGNFLTKWGSFGTSDGQFGNIPISIATDSSDNVYVKEGCYVHKFDTNGNFVKKLGGCGQDNGQFTAASEVAELAVDNADNVYVVNSWSSIQKFDSSGNFLAKWDLNHFPDPPAGVMIDSSGNIFAKTYSRIQKFDGNWTFLLKWGVQQTDDGYIVGNHRITTDYFGNIFVADTYPSFDVSTGYIRIQKFDNNGNFLTKWWIKENDDNLIYPNFPIMGGMCTDSTGNVYIFIQPQSYNFTKVSLH